jgi:hypothetical protein
MPSRIASGASADVALGSATRPRRMLARVAIPGLRSAGWAVRERGGTTLPAVKAENDARLARSHGFLGDAQGGRH